MKLWKRERERERERGERGNQDEEGRCGVMSLWSLFRMLSHSASSPTTRQLETHTVPEEEEEREHSVIATATLQWNLSLRTPLK